MLQQSHSAQIQQAAQAQLERQHEYEFEAFISQLPQCPPANAVAVNKVGWRFTCNPFTPDCFSPPLKKNPCRKADSPSKTCSMWALSMYESQEEAVAAYAFLKKSIKNISKTLGDHLSAGQLTVDDGKCTPTNRTGHFDFHPFINVPFNNKFQIISPLP